MKYKVLMPLALAAVLTGCDDAEYSPLVGTGDSVPTAFFAESISSAGVAGSTIVLPSEGKSVTLNVTLTQQATEDCSFRMVLDESVLNKYNSEQSSGYSMIDASYVNLGETFTIRKGEYSSDPVSVHISPLSSELAGTPLGVPIRLETVSGNAAVAASTGTYVYAISPVLVNDLPQFNGASGLHADNFNGKFAQFTLEVRFQVSNTSNRNRDVFSGGGVLMRFEDPQKDQDGHKAHSLVQFQGDGGYLNPTLSFEPNKWQHLACTWDGKTITIYVNGAFAGQKDFASSVVKDGDFPSVSWMGGASGEDGGHGLGSSWWYGCKILVTEARLWSVCRTADQIANNMKSVSVDSEGLEGYWRVNKATYDEATGSFEDLSGKGHPLVTSMSFDWVSGVSSEDEATEWK